MIMFMNLFRGASLSEGSMRAGGIDEIVDFPFIKNEPDRKFPADLVSKFDEVMSSTVPG